MPQHTKIATCCYCGTRAALVLRGSSRHELACGSCGAPLSKLKSLPSAPAPAPAARPSGAVPGRMPTLARPKPRKGKRRKSSLRWLVSEAVDLIEDIFD